MQLTPPKTQRLREQKKRGPPKGTRSTVHERLRSLEALARQLGVDPKHKEQLQALLSAAGYAQIAKTEPQDDTPHPTLEFSTTIPPNTFLPSVFDDDPACMALWNDSSPLSPSSDAETAIQFASFGSTCSATDLALPNSLDENMPFLDAHSLECSPDDILADLGVAALTLPFETVETLTKPQVVDPCTALVLSTHSTFTPVPFVPNLIELYATHVHYFIPMVDLPLLTTSCNTTWPFPTSSQSIDLSLLLSSMYALACAFCGRSEADYATAGLENFSKCKQILEIAARKPTLRVAQALANMCLYVAQCTSMGAAASDMYLAQAICVARQLRMDRPVRGSESDAVLSERVNTFWSLYMLDKYIATYLGRMPMILEDEADQIQHRADTVGFISLGSPFANAGVVFLLKQALAAGMVHDKDLVAGVAALSGHAVRWRASGSAVRELVAAWGARDVGGTTLKGVPPERDGELLVEEREESENVLAS
ncbi:hypothetical protein HDU93_005886 [Gonapodya sp. JEL0774]|nr:hypothetical protein HDU93_005886 [Gonapodya sp. JEL0774]